MGAACPPWAVAVYRGAVLGWAEAMDAALYGPGGFYRRENPAAHFRTSVSASPLFAGAIADLAVVVDGALGATGPFQLVDLGSGDGRLVTQVLERLPGSLRARTDAVAVDVRPRPPALPPGIGWTSAPPAPVRGLVVANEWLDNIPCDVVEHDGDTLRRVEVDPRTGEERLTERAGPLERAWVERWWPPLRRGDRVEVGARRDAAWRDVLRSLDRGAALAVDYAHDSADRAAGRFRDGTLAAFRDGRAVPPVPDGTCDLTAHVAIDACAAAGEEGGASHTWRHRQREALAALGVRATLPDRALAETEPSAYLDRLRRSSEAVELLDPRGLGAFWWLLQAKQCSISALERPSRT